MRSQQHEGDKERALVSVNERCIGGCGQSGVLEGVLEGMVESVFKGVIEE